jgi:hypothetical protein
MHSKILMNKIDYRTVYYVFGQGGKRHALCQTDIQSSNLVKISTFDKRASYHRMKQDYLLMTSLIRANSNYPSTNIFVLEDICYEDDREEG